jgi:hypothetical protein
LRIYLGLSRVERERLRRLIIGMASAPADARRLADAMIRRIGGSRQRRHVDCLRDIDRVIEYLQLAAHWSGSAPERKVAR